MKEELLRLAERCEQATGPDRELDAEIYISLDPERENRDALAINGMVGSWVPYYTASLDAAMALVPEGRPFILTNADLDTLGDYTSWRVSLEESGTLPVPCATPALALCAAALKARAASETPNLSPQGHSHE